MPILPCGMVIEGLVREKLPYMLERGEVGHPWVRMQSQVDASRLPVVEIAHAGAELETHQVKLLEDAQDGRSLDLHLGASCYGRLLKGASLDVGEVSAADAREKRAPLADNFAPGVWGLCTLLRRLSTSRLAFDFALARSAYEAFGSRVVRKVKLDGRAVFMILPS